MDAATYTTPPSALELLKEKCNRYANGRCETRACLRRGGYGGIGPVDYKVATCEYHVAVCAIMALQEIELRTGAYADAADWPLVKRRSPRRSRHAREDVKKRPRP